MALHGINVVEFAGLAPGPFAGLILADNGASVIRIDRPGSSSFPDIQCRGKRSIVVSPKSSGGLAVLRKLIAEADVLIDPFRPGVMERLGLGPDVFLGKDGVNRRLIYARIVGFSRTGPHQDMAGHDINYLALSGVLSMIPGPNNKPGFPLNLLADFAGGGLMCATGILLALIERSKSGRGQVVDTDMVSGARYVSTFPLLHKSFPTLALFGGSPGTNILDGGAPFYNVYKCSDGYWMSVGCLEPQFFTEFINRFNAALPPPAKADEWRPTPQDQFDKEGWSRLREYITKGFLTNTRDYWASAFHGSDACAVPVLTTSEAAQFTPMNSLLPSPHPELSRSPAPAMASGTAESVYKSMQLRPGAHTRDVLLELGYDELDILKLISEGALDSSVVKDMAKL